MKVFTLFILLLLPLVLMSQNLLNQPESVTYDSAQERYLVSNKGNGKIIAIDSQGDHSIFSSDQTSIRGILIKDDFVYSAGNSGLTCYNLDGTQLWQVSLPGSVFLNDVVADNSGFIYVSDNASNKIFKVETATQTVQTFVSGGITGPNGLYFDDENNRLIAVCWMSNAHIKAINLETAEVSTIITTGYGNLDGITRDALGNFYISSWQSNSVYKYASDFSGTAETFSTGHNGPADIFYDIENNVLAVPNFNANSVDLVEMPVSVEDDTYLNIPLLNQNYPNPFNPTTTISFQLSEISNQVNAKLSIYNTKGQKVKEFSGLNNVSSVIWNGTNNDNQTVCSGTYYYTLSSASQSETKKMVLLK